jgi:hypothetical protein
MTLQSKSNCLFRETHRICGVLSLLLCHFRVQLASMRVEMSAANRYSQCALTLSLKVQNI